MKTKKEKRRFFAGISLVDKKFNYQLTVPERPRALKSWENHARREIKKWIDNKDGVQEWVMKKVLSKAENPPGPFTRFLYHFAFNCQNAGWGVMVDFNEYSQQTHLCDKYYKWMHKLRDEIVDSL